MTCDFCQRELDDKFFEVETDLLIQTFRGIAVLELDKSVAMLCEDCYNIYLTTLGANNELHAETF